MQLARRRAPTRPSILGDDALAWALARAGRCEEALGWSRPRAPARHPGLAARLPPRLRRGCLGRPGRGSAWFRKALELNPHFSIRWSACARDGPHVKRPRRSPPLSRWLVVLVRRRPGAHPLGNFTVNRYGGWSSSQGTASTCATCSTSPRSRPSRTAKGCGCQGTADVLAANRAATPRPPAATDRSRQRGLAIARGRADSHDASFEAVYQAPTPGTASPFADHAFASRIGWREITRRAATGPRRLALAVPRSTVGRLRRYPQDLLRSPLARSASAALDVRAGTAAAPRPRRRGRPADPSAEDGLEA